MRQRDDLGPTAWNCHLHPSLRFSGLSNHLIHAFLAVASLRNLCPPKLLHLGTQHSVPRLFLLRLSMPPTATHQQDNSYGGSAIWRLMGVAPSGEYQSLLYLSLNYPTSSPFTYFNLKPFITMTKCEVLFSYAKLFVSFGHKQKENSTILIARGFAHNISTVTILVPL